MNELYRDYPIYIRKELEALRMNQYLTKRPRKKGLKCWRKLRLSIAILRNKAAK